jgi:hypothetical protein
MSKSIRLAVESRPKLRLVHGGSAARSDQSGSGKNLRWLINGYPAVLTIWTEQEWQQLAERPDDAQRLDGGLWCILRME